MTRGEGRREPERRGRKTEAEEKREGGKRKRAGRAIEGMRSGRQMAIVTATQKREKEGEEGRERREKGQYRVGQGVCTPSRTRGERMRQMTEEGTSEWENSFT